MFPSHTTIAAISTAPGTGAVAMIRLSGADALAIITGVWKGPALTHPRRAVYGAILAADGTVLDQVIATYYAGPASYTGEDTVEITCHGGVLITGRVLARLLATGATAAAPGQFTQRAYLNKKLDLTQAEAVMDLIAAQTDRALRAAQRQLAGGLGETIATLQTELLTVLAHNEAHIDFPEEDITPQTSAVLIAQLRQTHASITELVATERRGRLLREGARTVLAGAPNAGKSSLLNRLLGTDRAIVSPIPGTTRDTIEESFHIHGIPLRLIDTAGVRETGQDPLEQAGIARTQQQIATADLIIEVVDASQPPGPRLALPLHTTASHVLVLNKADLPTHPSWASDGTHAISISCQTGRGLESLTSHLAAVLGAEEANVETPVNARHAASLRAALLSIDKAVAALETNTAPEFTALDLRDALYSLGEVVGQKDTEDLLGIIFATFCIGK